MREQHISNFETIHDLDQAIGSTKAIDQGLEKSVNQRWVYILCSRVVKNKHHK